MSAIANSESKIIPEFIASGMRELIAWIRKKWFVYHGITFHQYLIATSSLIVMYSSDIGETTNGTGNITDSYIQDEPFTEVSLQLESLHFVL